jgi:hypothetical protein
MRINTRSIRFRLTAWYGSILVVLGLAFGAYCYWRLDHFLSVYVTELFSHRAERIAEALLSKVGRSGEAYDLLIATLPFSTGQEKYLIEVGGSAWPI